MAKVWGAIDLSQWPADASSLIASRLTNGTGTRRLQSSGSGSDTSGLEWWAPYYAEAMNAWNSLAWWKRRRWAHCAKARGMVDSMLYAKCWAEQNPGPGRQPISPCARRRVDPTANPHDYTP